MCRTGLSWKIQSNLIYPLSLNPADPSSNLSGLKLYAIKCRKAQNGRDYFVLEPNVQQEMGFSPLQTRVIPTISGKWIGHQGLGGNCSRYINFGFAEIRLCFEG
ncbi:hypothetical protein CEXT_607021 [Caerostris extrusa]|uniref:Uncharacterized protein n=1 Tax=Caerostris extrusa TaxID=172846 RepID=A0AAV4T8I8_CAEEX|nr:hypothetical protein CEXT_607021 [Caerostris extrusa]